MKIRLSSLGLAAALLASPAAAQAPMHDPSSMHAPMPASMGSQMPSSMGSQMPTEPGQGAFAAIQEIVGILEKDPNTDWSKVNIEALRQHLIDMSNVTLHAHVRSEDVPGGVRFVVTGSGEVVGSIRRMVEAHAATMNGAGGWTFKATPSEGGATLTVLVPKKDEAELHGLGFIGVLAKGMHHQMHHLMIARGMNPHG